MAEAERSYPSLCRFSHVARVPGNEPRPRRVESFEFMVDVLKCIEGTRRKAELRKDLPWERAALLEHVRTLLAAGKPDEAQREAGKYFEGRQQLSESAAVELWRVVWRLACSITGMEAVSRPNLYQVHSNDTAPVAEMKRDTAELRALLMNYISTRPNNPTGRLRPLVQGRLVHGQRSAHCSG